jgi:flavin reductase (DIM6/NTAB) family NADH-FMN oxidoreductase RutF
VIFDPDSIDAAHCYRILTGSVVPRAIAWVSTLSTEDVPNLAPFSFFTAVVRKPPMVSLAIQHRSDGVQLKDTLINIRATGEFVINIVSSPQANEMHAPSFEFSPEIDELKTVGIGTTPSHMVKPSRVADARVSIECRLGYTFPLGGVGDQLVICRILCFHVADARALEDGRIDAATAQVGRLPAEYVLIFSGAEPSEKPFQDRAGFCVTRLDAKTVRGRHCQKKMDPVGNG